MVAATLAVGEALPDLPAHRLDAIGDGVLRWFGAWAAYGAWEALDRALVGIGRAERRLPGLGSKTAGWLESLGQHEAAAGVRERR
jgi:hypothetical protein